MTCRITEIPGGGYSIICGRGGSNQRCIVCHTAYDLKRCDFPLTGPKAGQTCSRPVCCHHAAHIDPDLDYCPAHARALLGREEEERE